jgi:hypothetical protein
MATGVQIYTIFLPYFVDKLVVKSSGTWCVAKDASAAIKSCYTDDDLIIIHTYLLD